MNNTEYEKTKKNVYWVTGVSLAIVIIVAIVIFFKTNDTSSLPTIEDNTPKDSSAKELIIENAEPEGIIDRNNTMDLILVNGEVHWYSAGSSSCPPVIEKAVYTSEKEIELTEATYGKIACTMDLRAVHQVIKHADGTPIDDSVNVTANSPNYTIGIAPAE